MMTIIVITAITVDGGGNEGGDPRLSDTTSDKRLTSDTYQTLIRYSDIPYAVYCKMLYGIIT